MRRAVAIAALAVTLADPRTLRDLSPLCGYTRHGYVCSIFTHDPRDGLRRLR